jgi:hypothetical protein
MYIRKTLLVSQVGTSVLTREAKDLEIGKH